MTIYLIEVKYCPICGKGLFGKQYIESTDKLSDFMEEDEKFPVWNYKCNKCKSKFSIEVKGTLKELNSPTTVNTEKEVKR